MTDINAAEARRLLNSLPMAPFTIEKRDNRWCVLSPEWPGQPFAWFAAAEDADFFVAGVKMAWTIIRQERALADFDRLVNGDNS